MGATPLARIADARMKIRRSVSILCGVLALGSAHVFAEVKLPAIFSDHMVVQADVPVAVWGWAEAGEEVAVTFGGQTKSAKAEPNGRWSVRLEPMRASGEAREMVVASGNPKSEIRNLKVRDVVVGEVWLASGQSNMEMQIKGLHGSVDRADEEIAAA